MKGCQGRGRASVNTTLVINSKGGSGKTTITTTLASYFASHGEPTALLDYDQQGSALNWLRYAIRSRRRSTALTRRRRRSACAASAVTSPRAPSS